MAVLAAVGVMSIGWMAVITVLVTAQKLLPAKAAIDVPLAIAIVALVIRVLGPPRGREMICGVLPVTPSFPWAW